MSKQLKTLLAAGLGIAMLAGCEANGVDPARLGQIGGGNGAPPGSIADTTNCAAPVSGICVLGGESHPGGLVEVLLAPDGPLGPIAASIDTDALQSALTNLLENDNGDLAGVLTNLVAEGQLEEGLTLLLLGENMDGMGALAETLMNLLLPEEEGGSPGLVALVGDDNSGAVGLLQALLLDGSDINCQAPLGNLCLIGGEGGEQGLIDLLLTSGGVAGGVSQELTGPELDNLVATLGDLLDSNGALGDLATGLFEEGQLVEGLTVLLMGAEGVGDGMGLLDILTGTTENLDGIVADVTEFLGTLLTPPAL